MESTRKQILICFNTAIAAFILAFLFFDYHLYQEYRFEFFLIRFGSALIFLSIRLVLPRIKGKVYTWLVSLGFFIASASLSLTGFVTSEGFDFRSYVGILHILLVVSVLSSFALHVYIIWIVVTYAFHFAILSLLPWQPEDLFVHIYALGFGAAIAIWANFSINRIRMSEQRAHKTSQYLVKVFAHDFKNKLLSSTLLAQFIQKKYPADEETALIVNENFNMNRMVGNLINYFSEDSVFLRKEQVPVKVLQQDLNDMWKNKFKTQEIAFSLETNVLSETTALYDINYMNLVWDNLVSNMIQYTPDRGSCFIRLDQDNDILSVSFANSSTPIPPDFNEQLENKFNSPEKQTAYSKGLGLHYSKMMCEKHGGKLVCSVDKDNMNVFTVRLPMR